MSLPRDSRALRALIPALLGGLQLVMALMVAFGLAPLLRQGAISVSRSLFLPGVLRHFRRVRAVLALRAQEVRLEDRRLPVLLLRSFADDEIEMQRTKAFLVNVTPVSVGKSSARPPRPLVVHYDGSKSSDAPFAFVDKGITFDSGGVSIKPNDDM